MRCCVRRGRARRGEVGEGETLGGARNLGTRRDLSSSPRQQPSLSSNQHRTSTLDRRLVHKTPSTILAFCLHDGTRNTRRGPLRLRLIHLHPEGPPRASPQTNPLHLRPRPHNHATSPSARQFPSHLPQDPRLSHRKGDLLRHVARDRGAGALLSRGRGIPESLSKGAVQ